MLVLNIFDWRLLVELGLFTKANFVLFWFQTRNDGSTTAFIVGHLDHPLDFRIDSALSHILSELFFDHLESSLAFPLRFDNRGDVEFLSGINASFSENAFNTPTFTAEKAQTEDLAPASDSAAVQDVAFFWNNLVVEVTRNRVSGSGQAICGLRFTASRFLLILTQFSECSFFSLLGDVVQLRGHVVLEGLECQEVLKSVKDDIKADNETTKHSKPR